MAAGSSRQSGSVPAFGVPARRLLPHRGVPMLRAMIIVTVLLPSMRVSSRVALSLTSRRPSYT
jgi:hypothetical protein